MVVAGFLAAVGMGGAWAVLSLGRGFVLLPAAVMALYLLGAGTMIWWAALIGEMLSLVLGVVLLRLNSPQNDGSPERGAVSEAD